MEPLPPIPALPAAAYFDLIEAVDRFSVCVLFSLTKTSDSIADKIIRNFIARSTASLRSIRQLWPECRYGDCWSLFRVMVDRLVHLHALAERGDWQLFGDWSFVWQYEANQRGLGDPLMSAKAKAEQANLTDEQLTRYRELKLKNPEWRRPKAKDVFKSLEMPFLYHYAYDYASTQVHPMANDGEEDYFVLTRIKPNGFEIDRSVILNNSILMHTMILQEGMNASGMRWRSIVFDFLSQVRLGLGGDNIYRATLAKLLAAGPDFPWCERL
jgi:hypothetical protein